jgi:hypothetical protein
MSNKLYNKQTTPKGYRTGGNVQKINKAFGPKKNLKKVNSKKNPGLAKLPQKVRNKMGYMKKGGKV